MTVNYTHMENMEIPMTNSLPVEIPVAHSVPDGITNEGFMHDETVSGVEENGSPEVLRETFNTEEEEEILDSLETGFEEKIDEEILEKPETLIEEEDPKDKVPYHEQVSMLEEKIVGIEDINRQLTERVTNLEVKNEVSAEAMLKLLLMFQLLAKEEEQGEKTGMLEVLINFLVFFMKEAFIPKDENAKTQRVERVEHKGKVHPRRVSEILELLRNESAQQPFKTPLIENQAA